MKKSELSISSVPSCDAVEEPVDEPVDEPGEAGPEFELRAWTAGPQQHGQRLDRVLATLAPEFSRSYLQQLIELKQTVTSCLFIKEAVNMDEKVLIKVL